jgi:hypothetical protein
MAVHRVAELCDFGDNPRSLNQYDYTLRVVMGVGAGTVSPTGKLRLAFQGHKSVNFPALPTSVRVCHVVQFELGQLASSFRCHICPCADRGPG